jgi:hypothetical protein
VSKLVTPFGFESTTSDVLRGVDLSGKTALVTGANSGIGHETARALAMAGAAVVVAARRDRAGSDAAAQIAVSTGNPHVSHVLLDLADLESVARAATAKFAAWTQPRGPSASELQLGDDDVPSVVAGHVVPELPCPRGAGLAGKEFHAQVQQVGVRERGHFGRDAASLCS